MSRIQVRRGTTAECIPLRWAVLRPGMPESTAHLPGDDEPETFHVVAERDGAIVGCATFLVRPFPRDPAARRAWQLRGMAVDPTLQGTGVGTSVLERAIEILAPEVERAGDPAPLWCNARTSAASFYRRNGWVPIGEEFNLPPVGPHFLMRWNPAARPPST
jgi:GNAT superfamily N-acetyltransferase